MVARTTQKSSKLKGVVPVSKVEMSRSWVIYGRSGTGKTTFASTFPKPILYLDVRDKGTDSISDIEQIYVKNIQSFSDFEDVYWYLYENPEEYATVVVDTVSQLHSILVREVSEKKARKGKKAGDWGSLRRQDWGEISAMMKEKLMDYRDLTELGIEVMFIAQDRVFNVEEEDDVEGELPPPEVGPAISPSIAKSLNASASVVANTFIRERVIKKEKKSYRKLEYCLGIGPSSLYTRKVRKPLSTEMPSLVVDPDYETIVDIIKGN